MKPADLQKFGVLILLFSFIRLSVIMLFLWLLGYWKIFLQFNYNGLSVYQ